MKERYIHSVRALLDCPPEEKERLLSRLDSAVAAYLEDVPEAGERDLAASFGTPEDCAARLLAECAPGAVAEERRKKNRRRSVLVSALAVLLVAALGITAYLWAHGGLVVIKSDNIEPNDWESIPSECIVYDYDD